jgi:hypothetical protein
MGEIGEAYLRKTLIDGLMNGKVTLPTADRKGTEKVSMKELGISFPVLWKPEKVENTLIDNPKAGSGAGGAAARPLVGGGAVMPQGGAGEPDAKISVPQFKFNVQFCWQPKLPHERLTAKEQAEKDKPPAQDAAPPTP